MHIGRARSGRAAQRPDLRGPGRGRDAHDGYRCDRGASALSGFSLSRARSRPVSALGERIEAHGGQEQRSHGDLLVEGVELQQ